jgi:hypothetical protein
LNVLGLLTREVLVTRLLPDRQRLLEPEQPLVTQLGAGDGIVLECGAVGGADRTLGRQRTGRRAAGDAFDGQK